MMKEVQAKSDGTTLQEHIDECLLVLSELREALPALPKAAKRENFWDLLFCTVFLHDFGKAHVEFQKVLNNQANFWNRQRHELYSVPFVDKLDLATEEALLIKRAILGHHRSFDRILKSYRNEEDLQFEYTTVWKRKKNYALDRPFHPEDYLQNFQHNLDHSYLENLLARLYDRYGKLFGKPTPIRCKTAPVQCQQHPATQIAKTTLKSDLLPQNEQYWQNMLLSAATKLCDHYGSAGIKQIHCLTRKDFDFLDALKLRLKNAGYDLYEHQKACFKIDGNCLLTAPTGSGKTEAAMGWLRHQLEMSQGRAFYVLPYTASINAMHERLVAAFVRPEKQRSHEVVGIQHGKLSQYLSTVFEESTLTKTETMEKNRRLRNVIGLYRKMILPIKVTTPFQLLKYCYGVKGFDIGFAELTGAKLIFDEIHAYDEITFAQILVSLQHFTKYLDCSVMVMTATLPSFMMKELQSVLGVPKVIQAEPGLLQRFNRHRIQILEGGILDQIDLIEQRLVDGERVMIVCNTVLSAQMIFQKIRQTTAIDKTEITLLHGRFNYIDRRHKEKLALDRNIKVLVGTQAIEVSLDADFDVLFSEPAPLDALLQRFGRVNRRRTKDLADVFVCRLGGESDRFIYPTETVERTLTVAQDLEVIQEIELQDYLDRVYPDWSPKERQRYEDTRRGFEASLASLQPYSTHKEKEEEFYEKFDGIQVLPAQFVARYRELVNRFDFFEAEKYLVTIYRGIYFKLLEDGLVQHIPIQVESLSGKSIEKSVTVALCQYNEDLGLTDEHCAINDIDDRIC